MRIFECPQYALKRCCSLPPLKRKSKGLWCLEASCGSGRCLSATSDWSTSLDKESANQHSTTYFKVRNGQWQIAFDLLDVPVSFLASSPHSLFNNVPVLSLPIAVFVHTKAVTLPSTLLHSEFLPQTVILFLSRQRSLHNVFYSQRP